MSSSSNHLLGSLDLLRIYLGLHSHEDLEQDLKSPFRMQQHPQRPGLLSLPSTLSPINELSSPPVNAGHSKSLSMSSAGGSTGSSGGVVAANMKEKVKSAIAAPLMPAADPEARKAAMQDSQWADGLRGIASLYVVASHIVLCVARSIVIPCCGPDDSKTPRLFQRPILRLIAQGHSWVALFFVLLGFVNSLKPIKLARASQTETALSNLALASFRRTFRLVLPATAATIVSWLACQLGLYEAARNGDAYWLYTNTPFDSDGWGNAIEDLVTALKATWMLGGENVYDQPQWALIYLLEGSIMVFCALLMTVNLTSVWRNVWLGILVMWSWNWSQKLGDPLVGFTVFGGIILAELSVSDIPFKLSRFSPILTPPLIIAALVLMSFPTSFVQTTSWTRSMQAFAEAHFPTSLQWNIPLAWGSFGVLLLVFAVLISPHARRLLSRKPLIWLGKVSFPIYLLHGTFLRTVFAWILFTDEIVVREMDNPSGGTGKKPQVERYAQGGNFRIFVAIVVSMSLLLVACHFWAKKVEPLFGRITKAAEDLMTGKLVFPNSAESSSSPVEFGKPGSGGGGCGVATSANGGARARGHSRGLSLGLSMGVGGGALSGGGRPVLPVRTE